MFVAHGTCIFVSGPRGLLGSTVLNLLKEKGYNAKPLDVDVRHKQEVENVFFQKKPQWVIHTAAKVDVGACERDPTDAHLVNVEGTRYIVESAQKVGARVLYISTASVFKGDKGNYTERDIPEPTNVYNKTKHEAEQIVLGYEKGVVLRLNIIGIHASGSRGKNFLEWLVDSFQNNKDITLFADSKVNPLSNWTIAEIIEVIFRKNISEKILHIGSRDVHSKADIGRMVAKHFPNYSGTITEGSIDSIADGVFRPKEMWLNTEHSSRVLSLPMPFLNDELLKILTNVSFGKVGKL